MWTYLLIYCFLQKAASIRLVSIEIPERVPAGEGVGLSCIYDLEGDKLYNIKWYLDGVEFFRYVPMDRPSKLFFPVKGLQIDLERSENETVYIQNVRANTSGIYRCEISADAPSFQTLLAEKMMAVEEVQELQSKDESSSASNLTNHIFLLTISYYLYGESSRASNLTNHIFILTLFFVCTGFHLLLGEQEQLISEFLF